MPRSCPAQRAQKRSFQEICTTETWVAGVDTTRVNATNNARDHPGAAGGETATNLPLTLRKCLYQAARDPRLAACDALNAHDDKPGRDPEPTPPPGRCGRM